VIIPFKLAVTGIMPDDKREVIMEAVERALLDLAEQENITVHSMYFQSGDNSVTVRSVR
jgi:hypothetical protein